MIRRHPSWRLLRTFLAAGLTLVRPLVVSGGPVCHGARVRSPGPPAVASAFRSRSAVQEPAGSAAWVARQVENRDTGRDARFELRMRLFDRQQRMRERGLALAVLRGAAKGGATPGAPPGDRLLLRFTYPDDIKGTGFLVWEHPDADDERFLYLPALGRVRRIAGAEAQESFAGSDFSYEDIGGREFGDYTYRLLDDDAVWSAPDGTRHPTYRLESRRTDPAAPYPRVISLVHRDTFVVVHAEIYNRRNEREKVFDVRRLERVDGIWTSMDMVMVNELDGTRTELSVGRVDYGVGLDARDFSRRALEAGR